MSEGKYFSPTPTYNIFLMCSALCTPRVNLLFQFYIIFITDAAATEARNGRTNPEEQDDDEKEGKSSPLTTTNAKCGSRFRVLFLLLRTLHSRKLALVFRMLTGFSNTRCSRSSCDENEKSPDSTKFVLVASTVATRSGCRSG